MSRSPIHRDLRTAKYRKRVVESGKVYNRAKAQQAEETFVSDVQALEDGLADALEDERAHEAERCRARDQARDTRWRVK